MGKIWKRWFPLALLAVGLLLGRDMPLRKGEEVTAVAPQSEVALSDEAREEPLPVAEEEKANIQDPVPSREEEIYRFIQRFRTGLTDEEERELAGVIVREAERYDCPPELVLAIIVVESSFRHRAVSRKGALGLMQIRPHVAKALAREMGIALRDRTQVFDPEVNIRLGLYYLSKLLLRFKDLEVALVAYNYGPTYVARRLRRGLPLPRTYVRRVLRYYRRLSLEISQERV